VAPHEGQAAAPAAGGLAAARALPGRRGLARPAHRPWQEISRRCAARHAICDHVRVALVRVALLAHASGELNAVTLPDDMGRLMGREVQAGGARKATRLPLA
jgi:hypothetical protein